MTTQVILYYKITPLSNPKHEEREQRRLCESLGLLGRVLISPDGINGTLGGVPDSIAKYVEYCNAHQELSGIDFKFDYVPEIPFRKLQMRSRKEIVTTGSREKFDINKRSQHVDIDTFHQWLKNGEEMVILDLRNDYEWDIGRFKNSVRPPMKYFRDLDENLKFYEQYKDKKVVTFCTGGIRCEFATPQLVNIGFNPEHLYQLEGGVIKYGEKYGNEGFFEGKCFVFDNRVAIDINKTENAVVVGKCTVCGAANDTYRNCSYAECNKLFLACDSCWEKIEYTCSEYCREVVKDPSKKRPERIKVILHRNK
jgi:UPF0176 protein